MLNLCYQIAGIIHDTLCSVLSQILSLNHFLMYVFECKTFNSIECCITGVGEFYSILWSNTFFSGNIYSKWQVYRKKWTLSVICLHVKFSWEKYVSLLDNALSDSKILLSYRMKTLTWQKQRWSTNFFCINLTLFYSHQI